MLRGVWALFWWARGRSPRLQKRFGGTVDLTAVGMFGTGGGWAIPLDYHTLDVAVGGTTEKPGVVDGRIVIREYLCMTLSFDHDLIDGAPAAPFVSRLRELIESGYGLREGEVEQRRVGHWGACNGRVSWLSMAGTAPNTRVDSHQRMLTDASAEVPRVRTTRGRPA